MNLGRDNIVADLLGPPDGSRRPGRYPASDGPNYRKTVTPKGMVSRIQMDGALSFQRDLTRFFDGRRAASFSVIAGFRNKRAQQACWE